MEGCLRGRWRCGGGVLATGVGLLTPASLGGPWVTGSTCVPCGSWARRVNFNLREACRGPSSAAFTTALLFTLFPMPPKRGTELRTSWGRRSLQSLLCPQGPHTLRPRPRPSVLAPLFPLPHQFKAHLCLEKATGEKMSLSNTRLVEH